MPYLPDELMIQILLRLPVKSLIRFKCVSKSWFFHISHSHFANSHFQLTASTHTPRVLFVSIPFLQTRSINVEASLHDNTASASPKLNFMLPKFYSDFMIKGSCRGFILLHTSYNIYLWNPSTGLHKQIPNSIMSSFDPNYLYGFGYDPSTDDYLVFSISCYPDSGDISSYLEFFSLRDDTWEKIEGTHFPYMNASDMPKAGLFYNTAIHWLATRHDLSMDVIVAFDLMERKLFEISLPDDFHHEPINCDLWVFGEFISLWAMGDDTVEIWVMKEYKVHSSWTKTHVLSVNAIPGKSFYPLCCTKNGDIIGKDDRTGLVKYDDNGQLLERRSYSVGSRVAIYTESLICDFIPW